MEKSAEILDIFESFRKGMAAYFSEPAIPKAMKPRHSSVSARIAAALRPYFPAGLSIDIDLKGADILVHDGEAVILALFWSSSYLARDRKLRAIAFHEKENPPLTLAFSLFQDRNRFLVYRIEKARLLKEGRQMTGSCCCRSGQGGSLLLHRVDDPALPDELQHCPLMGILSSVPGLILVLALVLLRHPPVIMLDPGEVLLEQDDHIAAERRKVIAAERFLGYPHHSFSMMEAQALRCIESSPEILVIAPERSNGVCIAQQALIHA